MKHLPIPVFKVCPCVGVSLCNLLVHSGFGGRAGPEMSMGCIFPWGVLAATTLVGGRAGVRGTRTKARCKSGLFLSLVAVIPLSWVGLGAEELEQELSGNWVSPWYKGSLHLGLGHGWGLRAWCCTSVLVSLFPWYAYLS